MPPRQTVLESAERRFRSCLVVFVSLDGPGGVDGLETRACFFASNGFRRPTRFECRVVVPLLRPGKPRPALGDIFLLEAAILATIVLFWRKDKLAGALLMPYRRLGRLRHGAEFCDLAVKWVKSVRQPMPCSCDGAIFRSKVPLLRYFIPARTVLPIA